MTKGTKGDGVREGSRGEGGREVKGGKSRREDNRAETEVSVTSVRNDYQGRN